MAMYWGKTHKDSAHKRSCLELYPGYKFETLSLLDKPWGESSREEIEGREDKVVDNYAQYCSICKTEIGGASIVIGGEVDGGKESIEALVTYKQKKVDNKCAQFSDTSLMTHQYQPVG
jgi:hypothetical protein